jgi:hypothetical protein
MELTAQQRIDLVLPWLAELLLSRDGKGKIIGPAPWVGIAAVKQAISVLEGIPANLQETTLLDEVHHATSIEDGR